MFWKRMIAAIVFVSMASSAYADEPLLDDFKKHFNTEAFKIGALVQAVGVHETGDSALTNNGFGITNFRICLRGELDEDWGYLLQTSFVKAPALLDASVRFHRWTALGLEAGAFIAPFSYEYMIGPAAIDFVGLSQTVALLAPGRQVGVAARGEVLPGLTYALSAVNGNALATGNDDDRLMSVGRVAFARTSEDGGFHVAANAYQSYDTNAPIGVRVNGDFIAAGYAGARSAIGGDTRLTWRQLMGSAEVIAARFDPRGGDRVEPYGYHLTGGFKVRKDTQLLVRWDSFVGDGTVPDSDLLIFGLNFWPTSPTRIRVNVIIPSMEGRDLKLLANVQLAL